LKKENVVARKGREAMAKAGGEWKRAAKILRGWMRADTKLYREMMDPLVDQAIHSLLRSLTGDERRASLRVRALPTLTGRPTANPDPAFSDGSLRRLAARHLAGLLAFPLPGNGNLLLGDAVRAQVSEAADFYGIQAHGNARRGRWLRLVAGALPDGRRKVRDALDVKKLDALRQQANAEVGEADVAEAS